HDGSRKSRSFDGARPNYRVEHSIAARAGSKSIRLARTCLQFSLLLHAKVLVRLSRESAGRFSRRLRHIRRVVRSADLDSNQKAQQDDAGNSVWNGVLGRGDQLRRAGALERGQRSGSGHFSQDGFGGRRFRIPDQPFGTALSDAEGTGRSETDVMNET